MLRCQGGKSVTIPCSEITVRPDRRYIIGEEPAPGVACHNMIADEDVLRPRPGCRRVAPAGWVPLCHVGGGMLLAGAQSLGFATGGDVQSVAALQSPVMAALPLGDSAIVHTRDGRRLTAAVKDDECEVTAEPLFAPVMIAATSGTQMTATVASRRMTGNYPHNTGPLDVADQRALDADMSAAYTQCMATAAARGYYCQPVLARYRLLDAAGATLYVSAPVLVGPGAGFNGMGAVTLRSDDGMASRQGAQMTTEGYRLRIRAPRHDMSGRVATLLVEATAPLHPVDPRHGTAVTIAPVDQDNVRLYVRWADATSAESLRTCVEAAMETLEQRMQVVARVDRPYSGGMGDEGTWVTLRAPMDSDGVPAHAIDRVRAIRPVDDSTGQRTARRCRAPHTFVAEGVHADSDMAVWREPKYRLTPPDDIAGYQAVHTDDSAGQWRAYVCVTMADGSERLVRTCEGTGAMPRTLSGVLAYPCSEAASMTVGVTDGTKTYRGTFALTRCTHSDMAWWMSADGQPVTLATQTETFVVPAQRQLLHDCTGVLLIADGARPCEPVTAMQVSAHAVRDVLPADAGNTLWDKTRSLRRIVCDDGVYLLSVGADRRRTGLRRICAERLTAWCVDEGRTMYGATDTGAIIAIDDRRCRRTPLSVGHRVAAICANNADRRLTLLGPQGTLAEYDPGRHTLRTLDVGQRPVAALYDGALAATDTGLYDTTLATTGESDNTLRAAGTCHWSATVEGSPVLRPRAIVAHLTGGLDSRPVTAKIQCRPATGTTAPLTAATIRYTGSMTAPHSTPLPLPPPAVHHPHRHTVTPP